MADISMCSGNGCPKKTSCYRYIAPKSTYQAFLERTPDEDGECDAYWEVKTKLKIRHGDLFDPIQIDPNQRNLELEDNSL